MWASSAGGVGSSELAATPAWSGGRLSGGVAVGVGDGLSGLGIRVGDGLTRSGDDLGFWMGCYVG